MGEIVKLDSGALVTRKELPNGEYFLINKLDGWVELSQEKQAYLSAYFDTYPRRMRACFHSGIPQSTYVQWRKTDKKFVEMMDLIEQIHTEELEALEYIESYTDPKVRGRYLKNKSVREDKGSKVTVNNFNGGKASDILKDLERLSLD